MFLFEKSTRCETYVDGDGGAVLTCSEICVKMGGGKRKALKFDSTWRHSVSMRVGTAILKEEGPIRLSHDG